MEEYIKPTEENNYKNSIERKIRKKYELKMKKLTKIVGVTCFVAGGLTSLVGSSIYNHMTSEYSKKVRAVKNLEVETKAHGGYQVDGEYVIDSDKHKETYCVLGVESSVQDRIEKYCEENNLSDSILDMAIAKYDCYYNNEFEQGDKIDLVEELKKEYENQKSNELSK